MLFHLREVAGIKFGMKRLEVRKVLGDAKELRNLYLAKLLLTILAFAIFFITVMMNLKQLSCLRK